MLMEEARLQRDSRIVGINIHGVLISLCCLTYIFSFTSPCLGLSYLSWVTNLLTGRVISYFGDSNLTGKAKLQ